MIKTCYRFIFQMSSRRFKKRYPIIGIIKDIISIALVFAGIFFYLASAGVVENAAPGTSMLDLLKMSVPYMVIGGILTVSWLYANTGRK